MIFKVNHINIGLFYEAYFVCNTITEAYFRKVAQELERQHAVKTGIYVYDKEPLTDKIKRKLRFSCNVLFMLTPGETEKAAANQQSALRQVYGYVHNNNQKSISLVAVDGCAVDYNVKYPEDMKSFEWLHRKNFFISRETPENTAKEFCKELRRNYSNVQLRKFDKLISEGDYTTYEMYRFLSISTGVFALPLVAMFSFLKSGFSLDDIEPILLSATVFLLIFLIISLCIPFYLISWVYHRDMIYDVSEVFSDFRTLTRKRLAILSGISLGLLFIYLTPELEKRIQVNYDEKYTYIVFVYMLVMSCIFIYNLTMWFFCNKTRTYISFADIRHKIRLIFLPIFIGVSVFVFFYIRGLFLGKI